MGRRAAPAVLIAPGQITAHPDVRSENVWGPPIGDPRVGAWILVGRAYLAPVAVRVIWADGPEETAEEFDERLRRVAWEVEHPDIVAALVAADPDTRPRLRPIPPAPVPDVMADDLAELNEQARDSLR